LCFILRNRRYLKAAKVLKECAPMLLFMGRTGENASLTRECRPLYSPEQSEIARG
jgi:hypothetical protein